jgi:hypothetical protein
VSSKKSAGSAASLTDGAAVGESRRSSYLDGEDSSHSNAIRTSAGEEPPCPGVHESQVRVLSAYTENAAVGDLEDTAGDTRHPWWPTWYWAATATQRRQLDEGEAKARAVACDVCGAAPGWECVRNARCAADALCFNRHAKLGPGTPRVAHAVRRTAAAGGIKRWSV